MHAVRDVTDPESLPGEKGREMGEGSAARVDGCGVQRVGLAEVKRMVIGSQGQYEANRSLQAEGKVSQVVFTETGVARTCLYPWV